MRSDPGVAQAECPQAQPDDEFLSARRTGRQLLAYLLMESGLCRGPPCIFTLLARIPDVGTPSPLQQILSPPNKPTHHGLSQLFTFHNAQYQMTGGFRSLWPLPAGLFFSAHM